MYISTLITLGLAATASAIDVRAHDGDNCSGGYIGCANINPNVCCTFTGAHASIAVAAIPSNWRIRTQAFTGGGCSFFGGERDSNGATYVCLPYTTRGDRTGGKYFFIGRKRADDTSCPAEQPGVGKCEAVVQADTLGLADGTEYSIAGLSEDKVQELEAIASSGAGADAVPAEFQNLRR
ncbi:putative secreted protein [Colletotrichum tanaceti]|uniref:Putative secreted protein n=1 Tax=Colletotrichum tanaceti TaxID=1306861 RepID=A0A4U6XA99_9PEZI|nr:putative secreted protein [Colletotrichum tanaceti]TKW52254.1 putative secreted protein [Colletotrichum tanaceti]